MKLRIYTTNFYLRSLCLFLLTLVLVFQIDNVFAQETKKKKKKTKHLEIRVGLGTFYDNNILKYSDKYLNRFMNNEDPGRFHIDTYDDVVINPTLELIYTFRLFKKYKSRINGTVSPRIYIVNDIKNWNYWYLGFQQFLPKRMSFKILYSYIPDLYIRHFRDRTWVAVYGFDPITFQPFSFSKENFGFYVQKTFFKDTRVRLSLFHARYYHNKHFTEFDSKDFLYGIKVSQPLFKKLKVSFAYQYVTSDAKGYDASVETAETSLGPDADFVEDRFSLEFAWKLPRIKKRSNGLNVGFAFAKRYFSSDYPPLLDPLHSGRVDDNYRIYITYNINLIKSLKLSLFYNYYMRDSDTKAEINKQFVSNEKDYNQYRIGLGLVYKFKI